MKYVASVSCGKDSLAMVLRLIEENKPLTNVVMFDTEMEFDCIYLNAEKLKQLCGSIGVEMTILKPNTNWLYDMMVRPVNSKDGSTHYGYEWCGGTCRWRTTTKVKMINDYLDSLNDDITQYIGIAVDEPDRIKHENGKVYPLVEWNMTEKDCLEYCYKRGWNWNEDGVELYDVLDRVSCWCCGNKNLKELKNMYIHLPRYWKMLCGLQSRIERPFKKAYTIFELEKRFQRELSQMTIFDEDIT